MMHSNTKQSSIIPCKNDAFKGNLGKLLYFGCSARFASRGNTNFTSRSTKMILICDFICGKNRCHHVLP